LVRLGTFAALAGVVAGLWNLLAYFQTCGGNFGSIACLAGYTSPPGFQGTVVLALSIVLIAGSLATFLSPAAVFYLLAAAGILIDVIEVLNYASLFQGWFFGTLILVTLSLVLSLAAATRKTSVSEQSHPMNLPVFG